MDVAKAEVLENPQASRAVRQMAAINDTDAESGVHKVFKEHGLVPPIPISQVDLGVPTLRAFPIIRLQDWGKYLLDTGLLWRQMTGCDTFEKMNAVLAEFWNRMRSIFPNHGVYQLASDGVLELENTIPIYSHTDEGRSLKKNPILVISTHGVLGRGTFAFLRAGKHKAKLSRNSMGMNFVNHPMASHFVFATFLKAVSDLHPGCLDTLMKLYSEDIESLLLEGVTSSDHTKQVWFCHMNTKGDLPALQRVGSLQRNFLRAPKAKASKKPASGICHLCLAGKEHRAPDGSSNNVSPYPFEDLGLNPGWLATIGRESPWQELPVILQGVPLGDVPPASFFAADLWHCFHLGVAKHWVASSFVAIVEFLPIPNATSIEAKFEWLTSIYREFAREHGRCGWVKKIDREFLNFPSGNVCPIGSWNKGSTSTHLMKFLEWFCTRYVTNKTDNELLKAVVPCSLHHCNFVTLVEVPMHNLILKRGLLG